MPVLETMVVLKSQQMNQANSCFLMFSRYACRQYSVTKIEVGFKQHSKIMAHKLHKMIGAL